MTREGRAGHKEDRPEESLLCERLVQLLARLPTRMRRWQGSAVPSSPHVLSSRHVAALQHLRNGPLTVSELAGRLELTLPTVSGVLADLDRAGFVERHADPADRRRTIVQITPSQEDTVKRWLDGAAEPVARVLDRLTPSEQAAFLKAMNLLESELGTQDLGA